MKSKQTSKSGKTKSAELQTEAGNMPSSPGERFQFVVSALIVLDSSLLRKILHYSYRYGGKVKAETGQVRRSILRVSYLFKIFRHGFRALLPQTKILFPFVFC